MKKLRNFCNCKNSQYLKYTFTFQNNIFFKHAPNESDLLEQK